jgi:hypothetical protein
MLFDAIPESFTHGDNGSGVWAAWTYLEGSSSYFLQVGFGVDCQYGTEVTPHEMEKAAARGGDDGLESLLRLKLAGVARHLHRRHPHLRELYGRHLLGPGPSSHSSLPIPGFPGLDPAEG